MSAMDIRISCLAFERHKIQQKGVQTVQDISGIIIREHIEQKYVKKFPIWVSFVLLTIGAVTTGYYYITFLRGNAAIDWPIALLGVGLIATLVSLHTLPTHKPEEYLIEVTPEMSATAWLTVEQDFYITKENPQVYRCQRKNWKI